MSNHSEKTIFLKNLSKIQPLVYNRIIYNYTLTLLFKSREKRFHGDNCFSVVFKNVRFFNKCFPCRNCCLTWMGKAFAHAPHEPGSNPCFLLLLFENAYDHCCLAAAGTLRVRKLLKTSPVKSMLGLLSPPYHLTSAASSLLASRSTSAVTVNYKSS